MKRSILVNVVVHSFCFLSPGSEYLTPVHAPSTSVPLDFFYQSSGSLTYDSKEGWKARLAGRTSQPCKDRPLIVLQQ
jgi:hypothetical protein